MFYSSRTVVVHEKQEWQLEFCRWNCILDEIDDAVEFIRVLYKNMAQKNPGVWESNQGNQYSRGNQTNVIQRKGTYMELDKYKKEQKITKIIHTK